MNVHDHFGPCIPKTLEVNWSRSSHSKNQTNFGSSVFVFRKRFSKVFFRIRRAAAKVVADFEVFFVDGVPSRHRMLSPMASSHMICMVNGKTASGLYGLVERGPDVVAKTGAIWRPLFDRLCCRSVEDLDLLLGFFCTPTSLHCASSPFERQVR